MEGRPQADPTTDQCRSQCEHSEADPDLNREQGEERGAHRDEERDTGKREDVPEHLADGNPLDPELDGERRHHGRLEIHEHDSDAAQKGSVDERRSVAGDDRENHRPDDSERSDEQAEGDQIREQKPALLSRRAKGEVAAAHSRESRVRHAADDAEERRDGDVATEVDDAEVPKQEDRRRCSEQEADSVSDRPHGAAPDHSGARLRRAEDVHRSLRPPCRRLHWCEHRHRACGRRFVPALAGRRVSWQAIVRATIVIPTLNARDLLGRTLESLAAQTSLADVVVVDNASNDGTAEMVASRFTSVRVVMNQTNVGFGRAVNRAALELDTDVVVLVNNDVVCDPRFLESICEPFADEDVGMVAGVLTQGGAPDRIDSAGIEFDVTLRSWDYLSNEPVEALSGELRDPIGPCGGAAAYRLSAFRRLGGFDERLFAYWEDADLAIRLRELGWRCVLAPNARAEHRHGATIGAASPLQRKLDAFGRGYLLAKYGVGRRRPLVRLEVALLDWPGLLVHLFVRREAAPLRARRRGIARGRESRRKVAAPLELGTVPFREALSRQAGLLWLRLSGRLPAHYYEDAGSSAGSPERP